ncbi:MAG TPA: ABC transporter permease [Pseudobdellovibrionaceae bacterium]
MIEEITIAPLSDANRKKLEQALPMWKIVLSQFLEHKMAVGGAVIIFCFMILALSAPLIQTLTGIDPDAQNVFNRYQAPFSSAIAGQDIRETAIEKFRTEHPEIAESLEKSLIDKSLVTTTTPADALFELTTKDVPEAFEILEQVGTNQAKELQQTFKTFSTYHLFGTDELGRDVFIRLIYGTRISMSVGVLVAIVSALAGLLIGSLAGFYGGAIDTILMRLTDALLSLPLLPVMIVIAAIDLQKLPLLKSLVSQQNESILKMILILCLFSWMTVARLVRGSILSLREREFILAAKTLGATDFTIILRHMFPNVIAPMLVSITLGVGESILFEAALSFLGLGIQPPTPSWGNMLFNAQELIYQAPFLAILPGIMILLTVISFNYLGDGLQDAVDPKAIRR